MIRTCLITLLLWLFAGLAGAAEVEPVLLTRAIAGKTLDQAAHDLRRAVENHNYTYVREQAIDSRLVPPAWEAKSVRIFYFCNFAKMDRALRLDPREAQFLPCRITLVETAHGVNLIAVNPAWTSLALNNPYLHADCLTLKADYLAIFEELEL